MANHPSRSWRRRAAEFARLYIGRHRLPEPGGMHCMTREQLADVMQAAVLAGYSAGRIDVQETRSPAAPADPPEVH